MAIASFYQHMVLCITHSNDFYTIDIVQQSLEKAGYCAYRFNTDEFALKYQLNYILQNGVQETYLLTGEQKLAASQISAVWYRKPWALKVPEDLDPSYQDIFRKEYQVYLQMFFNNLKHAPWMNDWRTDHAVSNDKLLQLQKASEAKLIIPETIFTNDQNTIRGFFEKCKGELVVKLHGALSKSMEGNTPFFPTTKLTATDLHRLDQLAYCPMIFQQYVSKAYELRIVYIEGEFFTGKIPNGASTDWRTFTEVPIQWQEYNLPVQVCDQLSVMMRSLGLTFGVIDMIRNTNGEYVFLEVNPQGEWGMLQKYLNYPIGETIAQKLITRIKNG